MFAIEFIMKAAGQAVTFVMDYLCDGARWLRKYTIQRSILPGKVPTDLF